MTEVRWDADDYALNSGVQAGWAEELIGKLALKGDESVLDIGCGDGRTTAGLAALWVELIPKDTVHPSREAFEGWIRTTWLPYTQCLPENRRPAFVSALAGAYLDRHPADTAGRCRVRMVRLEVEARRD